MSPWKLHTKFLVFVLGSVFFILGAMSYLFVQREARLLEQKSDETQHILAYAFAADLAESMLEGRPRSTLKVMRSIRERFGLSRLEVLRRDGSPAFGNRGERLSIPDLERAFTAAEEIDFLEASDPPLRTIVIPLKNDVQCRACHGTRATTLGAVLVSISREGAIREIVQRRRELSTLLSAAILFLGGVLYVLIRKVVLNPLTTLHQGAERIGNGDLGHRIVPATRDELRDLALAFNVMAGRLEESYAGLEDGIRERTRQLRSAVAEIQDKATRLYAYSRDMATISRLSTKVFNAELMFDELLDRFMRGITRGLGYREAMLCIVDRKRVWIDVKRDTGMSAVLSFKGGSMLSDEPLINLIKKGNVEILDEGSLKTAGFVFNGHFPDRDLYLIPLLNKTHNRRCWQTTSCIKADCPAYSEQKIPCWLMNGTLCGNPVRASYSNKLAYCMTCQVFPVIGVLAVAADRRTRAPRNRRISVLRILAAEMASALENHRLHEARQQMVRELLELHRVTASALADLSLTKALDVFTDSALKFEGMDACNFWLVSSDGRELQRRAGGCVGSDDTADLCPDRLPVDAGLIGAALREGKNFLIEYNVPASDTTALGRAASTNGLHSLLAVPLKSEIGPLGVFSVHKRSDLPFLDAEIAAFMLLASQAAMAINVCILNEELKVQNRELARHTSLLSGILSSMSSGVMLLDEETHVTLINEIGAEILHSRRADLLNRRLTSLFPESSAFVSSDAGPYREVEIKLHDGRVVPVGFSKTFYRSAPGEAEGIIVVFRDLSEIKTLQAELLDKERFAAMGKVVAGVAHEIRNPLFGISSVGQILQQELQSPAHQELIRALLSESKRMNQLVEELLLYGRPMKLNREDCDITSLLGDVVNMHLAELDRKGVRLDADLHVPIPVYIDANQVKQVFLNLLRNAMEATDRGGIIGIGITIAEQTLAVTITDTGVGITSADQERIFDLFFTTKPKGTGLGLAICKKIIQDHGGDISVRSGKGIGSSFTIRLPHQHRQNAVGARSGEPGTDFQAGKE